MDEADELKDRFAGALIGLAVGDALGTTLEFSTRGSFEPINDMVGGGPFDLEAGQWTDDTSMALCLAESLVEDGFDPDSQMGKYIKWYMYGYLGSTGECFDIGNNTAKSLNHYRGTGEFPEEYEYAAGNGSLMRLAPVPMFFSNDYAKAVFYSGKSSLTTHNNRLAIDACRCFGGMIQQAITGRSKDAILNVDTVDLDLSEKVAEIVSGSYLNK
ncbi:MAG: ADP-ribosylglycohydrolase family protein, partial [Halanaerobiales bacterium]